MHQQSLHIHCMLWLHLLTCSFLEPWVGPCPPLHLAQGGVSGEWLWTAPLCFWIWHAHYIGMRSVHDLAGCPLAHGLSLPRRDAARMRTVASFEAHGSSHVFPFVLICTCGGLSYTTHVLASLLTLFLSQHHARRFRILKLC